MNQNKKILHIVLDEIGAMHIDGQKEAYFGVGGYITNDYSLMKQKCNKIEKILRAENKYIQNMPEIKGRFLNSRHITEYISSIKKENILFIPVHILVTKAKISQLSLNENEAYNFFVKWLLNYLIKTKIINNCNKILLLLDNRNISTKFKHSLQTHLNLFFLNQEITFEVKYKNSATNSFIRIADIICYCLYRENNYPLSKKTNDITSSLSKENIKLGQNKAIFPYQSTKTTKKIDLILKDDNI